MPRNERLYLQDILDACDALQRFLAGKTYESLINDEILSAAVLQKFIVIGEAATRLSDEFKQRLPAITWHRMAALRNVAVHAYFSIDWQTIWVTATVNVPRLAADLRPILENEPKVADQTLASSDLELPDLIVHADWSTDPRKRWMARAVLQSNSSFAAYEPELVGDTVSLIARLRADVGANACIFIGLDFPIGLPITFARTAGIDSFLEVLPSFGNGIWSRFYDVANHAGEIDQRRPFYPNRPGGTSQQHLLSAHGVASLDRLRRRCELAGNGRQAACPLFWTLGGNQVGKGAISGWRDLIAPALRAANDDVAIWPFSGDLVDLFAPGRVVIAETYPGEVYRHLGVDLRRGASDGRHGKRWQPSRIANAPALNAWMSTREVVPTQELASQIATGFGPEESGEDLFDAVVGLFGMIEVALGRRPDGAPASQDIRNVEGWILGMQA
jgi:uncharacterized protein with HEPN domain